MAARRLKPPLNLTNKQTNTTSKDCSNEILEISDDNISCSQLKRESSNNNSNNLTTANSSNCKCTNISIMHLFHEMKQQFPTVPDQIVNQCVNDNCHDRENCIIILRNELDLNPMPVQAYPSKALLQRSQQNQQNQQRKSIVADDDNQINCLTSSSLPTNGGDCCQSLSIDVKDKEDRKLVLGNKSHNNIFVKERNSAITNCDEIPSTQKRPTTLNLNSNSNLNSLHKNQSCQMQENYQRKNLRKPPLPPSLPKPSSASAPSSSSLLPENIENLQCNLTSPVKNGCESEISMNISLSPISELRRQRQISSKTSSSSSSSSSPATPGATPGTPPGTQRHRSFITVQPEPSYTREFLSPSNQKSFTSVNLTLRQPNTSIPKSTIDITAGPGQSGLSYSSTSYDARRGYQKNFHITVTDDGGGVFSASRIRPSSCYSPTVQHLEEEFNGNQMRTSISEQNFMQNINPLIAAAPATNDGNDSQDGVCDVSSDVLQKQIKRKEKLSAALKDNKRRLLQVQQEIEMLTQPINAIESEKLENDIKRLRYDCQKMLNEIENLKRSDANEDSYSINNMQQSFPRHKPPRPPYCSRAMNNNLMQQQQTTTDIASSEQYHRYHNRFKNSYNIDLPQMRQQNHHHNRHHNHSNNNHNHQQLQNDTSTDEEEFSEEVNSSEEECPKWACEMCTFRNHPLLNKCECCDNVRIIPGTIRIVSALPSTLLPVVATNANTAAAAATAAMTATPATTTTTTTTNPFLITQIPSTSLTQSNNLLPNNSTENENLTSQQLALHT